MSQKFFAYVSVAGCAAFYKRGPLVAVRALVPVVIIIAAENAMAHSWGVTHPGEDNGPGAVGPVPAARGPHRKAVLGQSHPDLLCAVVGWCLGVALGP